MAQPPRVPPADPIDGSETFFGIQTGRWKRFLASSLRGQKGDPGEPGQSIKGDKGDKGDRGDPGASIKGDKGDIGPAGKPKRIERYSATTNSSGVATFTFSPAFASTPDIQVIDGWSGDQMIGGGVTAASATGCIVQAKISRGTLLLTSGPFQNAPAGTAVTIRAIGD